MKELIDTIIGSKFAWLVPIVVIGAVMQYCGISLGSISSTMMIQILVIVYIIKLDATVEKLAKIEQNKEEKVLTHNALFLRKYLLSKSYDVQSWTMRAFTKSYDYLRPFGSGYCKTSAEHEAAISKLQSELSSIRTRFISDISEVIYPKTFDDETKDKLIEVISKTNDQIIAMLNDTSHNEKLEQILELTKIEEHQLSSIIISVVDKWSSTPLVED